MPQAHETKPTIAVDIDEVIFPMAQTFLEWHNLTYGSHFSIDQMTSYYVEELTGETEEQMLEKIKAYLETDHYKEGKPIAGTPEAIQQLKQKYRLAIITSRDHFFRPSTKKFLESRFGGLYDSLLYTHTEDQPNLRRPKYEICQEIGAKALIDDSLSHVIAAAENGVEAILFGDYAWNRADRLPSGVTRVKDWAGVLEYFNEES